MRIWPPEPSESPGHDGPEEEAPATVEEKIEAALKSVYDPEIPVNIHDLGLIYKADHDPETGHVAVEMTLTTPNCPEAEAIPSRVQQALEAIPEIQSAAVALVWSPPWDKQMMSEDAKLILGME